MSIPAIEPSGFMPYVAPTVSPTAGTSALDATPDVAGASGVDFAGMLSGGIERLQGVQEKADTLAVQAASGDLSQLHDYTIAATEANVTTQLTTAVRNKALESFLEIMRMPI